MVDSTKFRKRSSLILCPLEQISTLITDDGIEDKTAAIIEAAGIELVAVTPGRNEEVQPAVS